MNLCTPALIGLIFSIAYVVIDIINGDLPSLTFHIAAGIFIVFGLAAACNNVGELFGWILLGIPFVVLLIGIVLIWLDSRKDPAPTEPPCRCPYRLPQRRRCSNYKFCKCGCSACSSPNAPLPPSVTNVPPATDVSTIGCPAKTA